MTTAVEYAPTPVTGWSATEAQWLAARREAISASDVAAVLGYSEYATPWEVWADKTGVRPREVDASKEAILLGVALEPWLLAQARHQLGADVRRTSHRLFAHPDEPWQVASPDGEAVTTDGEVFGIECKTAGLASGFGVPGGWTDRRAPLGYEFQCRWQMRVMGWSKVVLIGLVANFGLRTYTYTRDLAIEADLVAQVAEWRQRYLVGRVEPAMSPRDDQLMNDLYRETTGGELKLDDDPDILEALYAHADGLAKESAGRAQKEAAAALLKRKLGEHAAGTIGGHEVITWKAKRGNVRWRDLITDLYEVGGWDPDGVDADAEAYRDAPSRSINVKGLGR